MFVTRIDAATNTVVVGERRDLATTSVVLEELSFVDGPPTPGSEVLVQYRAHGETYPARLHGQRIDFDSAVEAVAPGQSAALYSAADPEELLGGGIVRAAAHAAA